MFFPIALALVLIPLQNEKPAAPQDALALLNEVSQRYADAKSYHIEAEEERNSSNELRRDWQKTLLKPNCHARRTLQVRREVWFRGGHVYLRRQNGMGVPAV
jgi:hypothetical protein